MSRSDSSFPASGRAAGLAGDAASPDADAHLKNERMERREMLYIVVRDAMVRAGVLSASYKFKVLALDQQGSQFLIMMDLAREFGGDTGRLSDIEALIAQTAHSRYEIAVTAIYWRVNDHVAVGVPLRPNSPTGHLAANHHRSAQIPGRAVAPLQPEPEPPHTKPQSLPSAKATLDSQATRPAFSVFDPIETDEVLAFRKALGSTNAVSAASVPGVTIRTGPKRRPVKDDFADTEMNDSDVPASDLGGTQYGAL